MELGERIRELRKKKGVTQDALAAAIGVSSQAVSKWENGGAPDTFTLPLLADYFEISIDELFGRDLRYEGVLDSIVRDLNRERSVQNAFRMNWIIEKGLLGDSEDIRRDDVRRYMEKDVEWGGRACSEMIREDGLTFVRMGGGKDIAVFMPQPEGGWTDDMMDDERHIEFFRTLGTETGYQLFRELLRVPMGTEMTPFTAGYMARKLKLDEKQTEETLETFTGWGIVMRMKLKLDAGETVVYCTSFNPAMMALLFCASDVARKRNGFLYQTQNRQNPIVQPKVE